MFFTFCIAIRLSSVVMSGVHWNFLDGPSPSSRPSRLKIFKRRRIANPRPARTIYTARRAASLDQPRLRLAVLASGSRDEKARHDSQLPDPRSATALVAAMPLARAADSPGGFAYGTGPYGAGPHGSATANRDPHHNRFAPQGCIPLSVPRHATTVSLRIKVEPPGATVVFRGPHGTGGDDSVIVTGSVERVRVPVAHSMACADSNDATVVEIEVLGYRSARR